MKAIKLISAGLVLSTLVGCASIAGDNTRTVNVTSQPSGAAVFIDGQQYGVTPAVATLPTYIYGGKTVVLRKRGYQDHAVRVNTAFQPIALLDILCWPTFIIDAVTGSLVKIEPANRYINTQLHTRS